MKTTVKTADNNDIKDIAECEKICFSQPLSKTELSKMISDRLYTVLVLKDGNGYSGHIVFYTVLPTAEIISVAVTPQKRKLGYGKILIEEAKKLCFESGAENIMLEVRISNGEAKSLYEKNGFEIIAVRKSFYEKPVEDAYTMEYKFMRDKK